MKQTYNKTEYQEALRKPHTKWQGVYDAIMAKLAKQKVNIADELQAMKCARQDFYLWMNSEQKIALKTAKMKWAEYKGAKKAPGGDGKAKYAGYDMDEAVLINGKIVDISKLKAA